MDKEDIKKNMKIIKMNNSKIELNEEEVEVKQKILDLITRYESFLRVLDNMISEEKNEFLADEAILELIVTIYIQGIMEITQNYLKVKGE